MRKSTIVAFIIYALLFIQVTSCDTQTKSEAFHQILDNYFRIIVKLNPDFGSDLGLEPNGDYPYDKAGMTDHSKKAYISELEIAQGYSDSLSKFNNLSSNDKLELSVFNYYVHQLKATIKFYDQYYNLNYLHGFHFMLINLFTESHTINNEQDVKDYLSRMELLDSYFNNLTSELLKAEKMKIIPSKILLEKFQEIITDFLDQKPEEMIYYVYFVEQINTLEDIDESEKQIYITKTLDTVKKNIVPNYTKIAEHIDHLMQKADDIPGVWKLPDGDKFYQRCLKAHTTTDLTAEEIHQLGLQEVERIQQEMQKRFDKLGFTEGKNFGEIEGNYWNSLSADEFNYPKDDNGRQQVLEDYLQIIKETEERLPTVFDKIPSTPVTVRAVPPHKEQFSGQYYDKAPLDGSRPAIFYTNLSWLPKKPGMQTLLHHETIPGHHLQIAYAQELADIPIFRNLTFFTAYIEGWGLYAEKLAFEQGWYNDIHSELGYLNSELFRAVRLVVDTGIHYKKWSREETAEYMRINQGWASYGQINRYSLWPGQACAYKIGELKILELRRKAKTELGSDFDLKEFHDVVLRNGAIPLSLLENVVNKWIAEK